MYESNWKEYKKLRWIFWLIFLTYVPGVLAISFPLMWLLKSDIPFYIVALCWMVMFVVTRWRLSRWHCPRCGRWFFAKPRFNNLFTRKCAYCGLKKWATEDVNIKTDQLTH